MATMKRRLMPLVMVIVGLAVSATLIAPEPPALAAAGMPAAASAGGSGAMSVAETASPTMTITKGMSLRFMVATLTAFSPRTQGFL